MSYNITKSIPWEKGEIKESVRIKEGQNFHLGKGSIVNDDCYIDAEGVIEIGEDTIIGPHTNIYSSEHGIDSRLNIHSQKHVMKKTIIGNDVWIGANVVITGGVMIGDHSVIGAGSVATHNIPEWEIWAGNPAKKIGDRRTW